MRIYYEQNGADHWPTIIPHRLMLHQFALQLPKDLHKDVLIIDISGVSNLRSNYSDFNSPHKILMSTYDPYQWYRTEIDGILEKYQYNIVSLKKFPSYSFWGYYSYITFQKFRGQDFPFTPKHLFLNYNRKPRHHRVDLINTLTKHELDRYGIITLGVFEDKNRHPNETIMSIPGNDNVSPAPQGDWNQIGIPNDLLSLGDSQIWNNSFINLVSESCDDELFVSEKTYKPIIGKRPFIINGSPGTLNLFHSYGFKTFGEYWDESYDNIQDTYLRHEAITKILKDISKLSPDEILRMYKRMQHIMQFNHDHFFGHFGRANQEQFKKLGTAYMEHYF